MFRVANAFSKAYAQNTSLLVILVVMNVLEFIFFLGSDLNRTDMQATKPCFCCLIKTLRSAPMCGERSGSVIVRLEE